MKLHVWKRNLCKYKNKIASARFVDSYYRVGILVSPGKSACRGGFLDNRENGTMVKGIIRKKSYFSHKYYKCECLDAKS